MGILKLGVAVFGAYLIGGKVGAMVVHSSSVEVVEGAKWAGRAVAFVGIAYVLGKL
jgi:hypothetical protein